MPLLAAICSPLQGSSCKYASLLTLGSVSQAEGRRFAATQPQALGQLRWPANPVSRSGILNWAGRLRASAFFQNFGSTYGEEWDTSQAARQICFEAVQQPPPEHELPWQTG